MKCPLCGDTLRRAKWSKGKATCAHCGRTWDIKRAVKRAIRARERAEGWTWWRRLIRWALGILISIEFAVKAPLFRWKIKRAARNAGQ